MLITKETSKDLDTLYGQFFNLNSLFDRAVSVMLNDWAMVQASDIIHHKLAHLFPLMADMVSEIKDDVKRDLKPYDVYNTKRLHNQFSGLGTMLGRIVINKNLEPRFIVSAPSTIPSRADIQLEAALTIEEVKELANKCLRIKMDADIEKFRKDKVNKAIRVSKVISEQ